MADLRPQHDEEVVAANHPTKADVTNRAWNIEHEENGMHKATFLAAPTGTIMLFGQNSAPTGWTRKADWQDNAMLCYASAGAIGSGGAVNPQSTHIHGIAGHANHFHNLQAGTDIAAGANFSDETISTDAHDHGAATAANSAPFYQEIIAATKD